MRVALIQVASPDEESIDHRRSRVAEMVHEAAGSRLIVLPELWAVGYFDFESYASAAEAADGRTVTDAQAWARDLDAYVFAGSYVECDDSGHLHNSTVLVDPEGRVLHRYRKIHVFGYESLEAKLLTPGDDVETVETPFGRLGATTCYDLRFPELWRGLVGLGAEIVITPSSWPRQRLAHWQLLTRARAVEEEVLLIACNATGVSHGVHLAGHSCVISPWGDVLAEAGDEEGVTFVDVDPSVVGRTRADFSVLDDRYDTFTIAGSHATPIPIREPLGALRRPADAR